MADSGLGQDMCKMSFRILQDYWDWVKRTQESIWRGCHWPKMWYSEQQLQWLQWFVNAWKSKFILKRARIQLTIFFHKIGKESSMSSVFPACEKVSGFLIRGKLFMKELLITAERMIKFETTLSRTLMKKQIQVMMTKGC